MKKPIPEAVVMRKMEKEDEENGKENEDGGKKSGGDEAENRRGGHLCDVGTSTVVQKNRRDRSHLSHCKCPSDYLGSGI